MYGSIRKWFKFQTLFSRFGKTNSQSFYRVGFFMQISTKCSRMKLSQLHTVTLATIAYQMRSICSWRMGAKMGEKHILWYHPKWFGSHSALIDKKTRSCSANLWIVYIFINQFCCRKTTKRKFLARQAFNNGTHTQIISVEKVHAQHEPHTHTQTQTHLAKENENFVLWTK